MNVKWGKEKYTVELNLDESPIVFKAQLYALTGVPIERQKGLTPRVHSAVRDRGEATELALVMGVKGGTLKDDAVWSTLGIKEVCTNTSTHEHPQAHTSTHEHTRMLQRLQCSIVIR